MNWEAISTIAEIVGMLAVVATLIFLVFQIRQSRESLDANTKAIRAGTSSTINEALSTILGAIRSDGEFAEIWLRGCRDLESLDDVEKVRFTHHLLDMLNLATYVDELEGQGVSDTHIDYIPWITTLYRDNPGIHSFVDSLEDGWAGTMELYRRITDVEGAKGANIYQTGLPQVRKINSAESSTDSG